MGFQGEVTLIYLDAKFGTLFRSSVKKIRNYDRKSRCDALPVLARHSARKYVEVQNLLSLCTSHLHFFSSELL